MAREGISAEVVINIQPETGEALLYIQIYNSTGHDSPQRRTAQERGSSGIGLRPPMNRPNIVDPDRDLIGKRGVTRSRPSGSLGAS